MLNVLQAVILTNKEKMILTPTYHVMEMYNVHQGATLLPLTLSGNLYTFEGQSLPSISASASKDSTGAIHISLVNIDPAHAQKISLTLDTEKFSAASAKILSSKKLQDHNSFEEPEKIKPVVFNDYSLSNGKISINLPATSVVVITLK